MDKTKHSIVYSSCDRVTFTLYKKYSNHFSRCNASVLCYCFILQGSRHEILNSLMKPDEIWPNDDLNLSKLAGSCVSHASQETLLIVTNMFTLSQTTYLRYGCCSHSTLATTYLRYGCCSHSTLAQLCCIL